MNQKFVVEKERERSIAKLGFLPKESEVNAKAYQNNFNSIRFFLAFITFASSSFVQLRREIFPSIEIAPFNSILLLLLFG